MVVEVLKYYFFCVGIIIRILSGVGRKENISDKREGKKNN